jgi:hypothetical protein
MREKKFACQLLAVIHERVKKFEPLPSFRFCADLHENIAQQYNQKTTGGRSGRLRRVTESRTSAVIHEIA